MKMENHEDLLIQLVQRINELTKRIEFLIQLSQIQLSKNNSHNQASIDTGSKAAEKLKHLRNILKTDICLRISETWNDLHRPATLPEVSRVFARRALAFDGLPSI